MQISIADNVARKLKEIAANLGGSLEVGFLEGATYPDGTPVAAVAFWNEFGNGSAPPRPFFRQMIAKESPEWPAKIAALARATDNNGAKVLALMGEDIEGALKQSINDFTTPGLAQSTIDRKGFDKPLIDTSHMLNSTGYRVIGTKGTGSSPSEPATEGAGEGAAEGTAESVAEDIAGAII